MSDHACSFRYQVRRIGGVALTLLMLVARPCSAFDYSEHQEIVCSAVESICKEIDHWLASTPALDENSTDTQSEDSKKEPAGSGVACTLDSRTKDASDRLNLVKQVLCAHSCGAHPATSALPWVPLFDENCHLDLGDAVALVDHANLSTLSNLTCKTEDRLRENPLNYGLQSLFADEHFCPTSPTAYAQYHRMAKAQAILAASSEHAVSQQLQDLRQALFAEAYGLHFYTDNFSAGHLRARLQDTDDNVVTKRVHDYYSEQGLMVQNGHGERWMAYGDGNLTPRDCPEAGSAQQQCSVRSTQMLEHKRRAIEGVTESLRAVLATFVVGQATLKCEQFRDSAYLQTPVCFDRAKLDGDPQPGDFYKYSVGLRGEITLENWDFTLLVATQRWLTSAVLDVPLASWVSLETAAGFGVVQRGLSRTDMYSGDPQRQARHVAFDLPFRVDVRANPVLSRFLRLNLLLAPVRLSWQNFAGVNAPSQHYPRRLAYEGWDFAFGPEFTLLHVNLGLAADFGMRNRRRLEADGTAPARSSFSFSYGTTFFLGYRW